MLPIGRESWFSSFYIHICKNIFSSGIWEFSLSWLFEILQSFTRQKGIWPNKEKIKKTNEKKHTQKGTGIDRQRLTKMVLIEEQQLVKHSRFKRVCVFCGSATGNRNCYSSAALELGQELVRTCELI